MSVGSSAEKTSRIMKQPVHPKVAHFLWFCIAALSHVIHLTTAQTFAYICGISTNYTSPSPYSRNLNLTLSSLAANASKTGYFTAATGNGSEVSYGLVQCRGYASLESCKGCAKRLSARITKFCPNQKEASIFNDNCTLQYADWNFFSTVDATPYVVMASVENVTYPDAFNVQLPGFLENLSSKAAADAAKLAVGRSRYISFEYVYAMVQCVLDLSVSDCQNCLQVISSYIPRFMADKAGGRLFALSCNLRYEKSSFFQLPIPPPGSSALPPLMMQPNSTFVGTNSTGSYGKNSKTRSVTMVVIPVLASVSVLALGKLPSGQEIAVKRLSTSSRLGLEELKTEVMLVAKLLHTNLVRLLGFCLEEDEKLLVYEYLPNGSLDEILYDELDTSRRFDLDWGASGYMAPEYARHDHFSVKSDVYSFGILVLEIVTGRRNNSRIRNSINLQSHVWDQWSNGMAAQLRDPAMGDRFANVEVLKCIHIGLLCVQESVADRPTMSEVVLMLSSHTVTYPTPLRPAFFINREGSSESDDDDGYQRDSAGNELVLFESEPLQLSINDVSITDLHPRPNITTSTPSSTITCPTDRNYTSGSRYQTNLNLTLTSLANIASVSNYFTTSTGQTPDVVYGLVQCTGYTPRDACQACASNMVAEIIQTCSKNQKQGSAYMDKCSLQYSDRNFFSTMDSDPRFYQWNTDNATDLVLFQGNLEKLLNSLSPSAANDPSRISFGMSAYTEGRDIYAMVQCSKGISGNDCLTCLERITASYMFFLNEREQGETGLLVAQSCNLRVDTYQFLTLSSQPRPSKSSPPPSSDSESDRRRNDGSSLVRSGTGKKSRIMIMLVMAAAFALVLIVITGIYSVLLWRNQTRSTVGESNRSFESLLIEFEKLREATGKFSDGNKLGQGGFGPVYKGKMRDGQEIAVKRLSSSSKQGLEELQTEVMLVAKLMHQNLVRLIGFCIEEEEKILVYEYLPNGSLDKFLFDQKRSVKLTWEMRYNIIVGIARGLLYLHEEYPLKIIHRDMKASNVLLDESMTPKISDFGLARLFPGTENHCFTNRIIGTYGYMAPEYAVRGRYSTKSDVYSFGILVLEIITGRKNSSFEDSRNLQSFVSTMKLEIVSLLRSIDHALDLNLILPDCCLQAWKHWINGTALTILDPILGEEFKKDEVLKCINVGLLSVQEVAEKRPRMSEIISKLGSYTKLRPSPLLAANFNSKNQIALDYSHVDSDVTGSNQDSIA
ncbi:Cysteine-rich receptor-like protein kinase 8 [Linum grandiflorum]